VLKIGIDIGGTFTDFAIWKGSADSYVEIGSYKIPTSRPDFSEAVRAGIDHIAKSNGYSPDEPLIIVHGTTISTNAVIERSQPEIGLITTKGFRDILGIARLRLSKPVDIFNSRPLPLISRQNVFTVDERMRADQAVDTPLADGDFIAALDAAVANGLPAIGICFLHAHTNPAHEVRALEIARQRYPDLEVMASHQVWPQQSEYERATITLLNVYVKQLMNEYLRRIDTFLSENYRNARLYITKSNGGMMSSDEARELPIHTLLSGPAAGVTGARTVGEQLGIDRILTFDMGGTSTDMSLIEHGRPMVTGQAEVGDFPLMMPVTAVEAMGAGGGSIVWLDGPVMKVGPKSAGSLPGPACYDMGGTAPALSDAYLIANYLTPQGLLGGKLTLKRTLAEKAFAPIAEKVGCGIVEAAESAINIATSNMLAKVTPFLARLGVGAADLTLMIFGGAGGIHGPLLASEIGIRRVVIPRIPSVFCAYGGLVSDLTHDGVVSVHGISPDREQLSELYRRLLTDGRAWIERQHITTKGEPASFIYLADMRYAAQSFTLSVDLTDIVQAGIPDVASISEAFHQAHKALYGHFHRDAAVLIDNIRVRSVGHQEKPGISHAVPSRGAEPAPVERRDIRLRNSWVRDVCVHQWNDLPAGWTGPGPMIIQQEFATVLVPDGYRASVGRFGDLEMERL
jgi:N-methylhydantoinase A